MPHSCQWWWVGDGKDCWVGVPHKRVLEGQINKLNNYILIIGSFEINQIHYNIMCVCGRPGGHVNTDLQGNHEWW